MKITRRHLLLGASGFAGGALAMGGVAALGRGGGSAGPGELIVISGADQSEGGMRRELIRRWNELNPDYPARMIELGGVADDHRSEMVARAQADEPSVDVFNLDVTWIAEFAGFRYIQPLPSDPDTEGFLGPPLETCRHDDGLWALPFNTDAGLLFVNWDMLGRHLDEDPSLRYSSSHRTWEDIQALVDAVRQDPPDSLEAGYAGQHRDYEGLTVNALEWPEPSASEDFVDGDSKDPEVDADAVMVDAVCQRRDPPFVLADSDDFAETETTRAFRLGRVAFMRNWPVAHAHLQQAGLGGDETATEGVTNPGIWRLPGASVLGGQNLAVARRSPRPEAAQRLIEFLTNEENQADLFRIGGLAATRVRAYDQEQVKQARPYADILRDVICQESGSECLTEVARRRPSSPYYSRFSQMFRAAVRGALDSGVCNLPGDIDGQLELALRGMQTR